MKQNQSQNQSNHQEIVIDFSKLSDEEKETYIKHLMMNYPQISENSFQNQTNELTATIKIAQNTPLQVLQSSHTNQKQEQISQCTSRQKQITSSNTSRPSTAFTPAKTKRNENFNNQKLVQNNQRLNDNISHLHIDTDKNNEQENLTYRNSIENIQQDFMSKGISLQQQQQQLFIPNTGRTTQRSTTPNIISSHRQNQPINKVCIQSSQIALNQIILGSQENYPLFYSYIKQVDKWIRPKRMSKDQTQKLIEEIYTSKFQKETQHLLSGKSSLKQQQNIVPFPQHVYETLKKKSKQQKQLEQYVANLLVSIEFYSQKQPEIRLFKKFLSQSYDDDDLIFFLFARVVSERVVGVDYYQHITQKFLDPSLIFVNITKAQNIVVMVYGEADKENLSNAIYNIKKNSDFDPADKLHKREKKISVYKILIILISLYSNKNLLDDTVTNVQANKNQNRDQNISKITERIESFITSPIYSNNKFNTQGSVEKQVLMLEKDLNDIHPFVNENQNVGDLKTTNQINGNYLNFEDQLYDTYNSLEQKKIQGKRDQQKDIHSSNEKVRQSFTQEEKDILKNISLLDQRIQQRGSVTNEQFVKVQQNALNSSRNANISIMDNRIRERSCEEDQELQSDIQDSNEEGNDSSLQNQNKNLGEVNEDIGEDKNLKQKYSNPFMEGLVFKSEFQIEQERKQKEAELELQRRAQQQEEEKFQSESYQIEMQSESQQMIFMNVHQRLEEFIEVMIMDSAHLSGVEQQQLKDKLYDFISRRVNDLLASIFNANFWIWFRSCQIQEPTTFQIEYLQDLLAKFQRINQIPPEQISKIDLNQFSKKVLQTPELAKEIGRLIVNLTLN